MAGDRVTVECPGCGRCFDAGPRAAFASGLELDVDPELADPAFLSAAAGAPCPHCGHVACCAALAPTPPAFPATH
jgi:endogenous inhibitor of DNA gyrase (YacG/DUF329 family)